MGYLDESGVIREELLDKKAQEIAESFIQRDRRDPSRINDRNSLSSAQLRRFFNEFRQLEKKVKTKGFKSVRPLIKMVKSKASYAANPKKNGRIPESFKMFIVKNVDQINEEKDFEAFMQHFEAVVGFFYGLGISNN